MNLKYLIKVRSNKSKKIEIVLVGLLWNRKWVLGNLLNKLNSEFPYRSRKIWLLTLFARHNWYERFLYRRLPKSQFYFFSYLSIFEKYLQKDPEIYRNKSIVFYTHFDKKLGSISSQAESLSKALKIYVMCSHDKRALMDGGLDETKIRIVYFGIDSDVLALHSNSEKNNLVILASKFGPRKGLEILPSLIREMPTFEFMILGRNWEKFIEKNSLNLEPNFQYQNFNFRTRNEYFPLAKYFLSLSELEGGPIPLLECLSLGVIPICTNTGFAPDLIEHGRTGYLLNIPPTVSEVKRALLEACNHASIKRVDVSHLTWKTFCDHLESDTETPGDRL